MCTGAEIALLGTAVAGTAVTVKHQQDMKEFQVEQAQANAATEQQSGELRAEAARDRARRVAATARAALVASGVKIDSVTGNLINQDIIERGNQDAAAEVINAGDRATALRQQADVFKMQSRQAVNAGALNLASSAISTGARSDGSWYGVGGGGNA